MAYEEPGGFGIALHSFLWHHVVSGFYRGFAESLNLRGHERVLDFGCGPGALSKHVAAVLLPGGGRVLALDPSEAWINEAKKKLKHLPNVDYWVGRIETLAPEPQFDAIVIHYMLHDVDPDERPAAVKNLALRLKTGAKLFIREPTRPKHGMSILEIRSLMSGAGLSELEYSQTKKLLLGPMYSGVFARI